MKPINDILAEIGNWLALLVLMISGLYFLLDGFGVLAQQIVLFLDRSDGLGHWLVVLWGALSILLGIYFVRNIIILHRARGRIMSAGPRGPIWISPIAVRDFILKTVQEQHGLERARVFIHMRNEGIAVRVKGSVPLSEPLTDMGERIQEDVKSQVESRIGIRVQSVEVDARNITTTEFSSPARSRDEEYTPLEIPDRDRYE